MDPPFSENALQLHDEALKLLGSQILNFDVPMLRQTIKRMALLRIKESLTHCRSQELLAKCPRGSDQFSLPWNSLPV
jgi:hypothetical protein